MLIIKINNDLYPSYTILFEKKKKRKIVFRLHVRSPQINTLEMSINFVSVFVYVCVSRTKKNIWFISHIIQNNICNWNLLDAEQIIHPSKQLLLC